MKAASGEPGLTFDWRSESGFPFILFWCVTISLLAHAATFFLFQIVYPQHVTIPQPAPHVSLLTPSSPENIALLRWIEAEDPALIANDNSVSPPALAEVRYLPSFATPHTAPLGAPVEKTPVVRFPPAIDRLSAEARTVAPTLAAPSLGAVTVVRFADGLDARALASSAPLKFPEHTAAPVHPTTLLIGVNAAGEVRCFFLQQSSGDQALDEIAADYLRRIAFAPAGAEMMWGHASFAWGADAYGAKKTPAE
jgi:hypothetical protein